MFKIGDFSKIGQVSVRMLRHYDQLGLLKPNAIDRFTSYRYYTIEQLPRLNRILALKDLGLSLEQIKELLDHDLPAEQLRGMLVLKQTELERELQEGQARLARVAARLQRIEQEGRDSPYEIMVKPVGALTIASVRQVVPTVGEMDFYCRQLYQTLYQELAGRHIDSAGPEITLYHNDEYIEQDIDVEVTLPVDKAFLNTPSPSRNLAIRELPAEPMMASLLYEGPYQAIGPAILDLLIWVGQNNAVIAGPLREVHLSGPAHDEQGQVVNSAVLEFQAPIKKQTTA